MFYPSLEEFMLCTMSPITLQYPPKYQPILFGVIGEFLAERIGKSKIWLAVALGFI